MLHPHHSFTAQPRTPTAPYSSRSTFTSVGSRTMFATSTDNANHHHQPQSRPASLPPPPSSSTSLVLLLVHICLPHFSSLCHINYNQTISPLSSLCFTLLQLDDARFYLFFFSFTRLLFRLWMWNHSPHLSHTPNPFMSDASLHHHYPPIGSL